MSYLGPDRCLWSCCSEIVVRDVRCRYADVVGRPRVSRRLCSIDDVQQIVESTMRDPHIK